MLYNFLKTSKKAFGVVFSVFVIFMLTSCENSFEHNSEGTENQNGKTYLSINVTKSGKERTITPTAIELSDLQNFSLKGTAEGESTPALNKSYNTYQDISENSELEIAPGKWTFILSAEYSGSSDNPLPSSIQYLSTVTTTIQNGKSNPIYFVLTPQVSGNGELEITFTKVNTSRKFDKIRATLTTITGSAVEIKEDFSIPETDNPNDGSITYSKSDLEPGTYHLLFEFLINKEQNNYQPAVNQWESYVYITPGVKTSATISLEKGFNKVYTIRYEDETGQEISDFSGFAIKKYSARSSFDLPKGKQTDKVFLGWKKYNSDGTYEYITKITNELNEDLVLVADLVDPVLYVSSSGTDSNSGFASTTPLETFTKAFEKMETYGYPELDWTIKVSGTIKGGTNGNYAQCLIPESINDKAKSLHLDGATGVDGDGLPQDRIDKGWQSSSGLAGFAVKIDTTVPVTITNLEITKGRGGLYIAQGATVMLGNGVRIIGNNQGANGCGGGVRNEGTLFVYGSAVIGNQNATQAANGSSSDSYIYNYSNPSDTRINANYSIYGAGIYNGTYNSDNTIEAKLYLGYRGFDTDGVTPVEETLTGGIYANSASSGGGIYNDKNSTVYYKSGTIKYNGTSGEGGGIVNYGLFEMCGENAKILNNTASSGGGINNKTNGRLLISAGQINNNTATGYGGGIYNVSDCYIYSKAIIGDKTASTAATATAYGNTARNGGGISNSNGNLYVGYKPDGTVDTSYTTNGGIYYNYATGTGSSDNYGGGAIYNTGSNGLGKTYLASGTLAYNSSDGFGGAIYVSGNLVEISGGTIENNLATNGGGAICYNSWLHNFAMKGNPSIPKGSDSKNDILLKGLGDITISGALDVSQNAYYLTFSPYNRSAPVLILDSNAETTLTAEYTKFEIAQYTFTDQNGNQQTSKFILTDSMTVNKTTGCYLLEADTWEGDLARYIGAMTTSGTVHVGGEISRNLAQTVMTALESKPDDFRLSLDLSKTTGWGDSMPAFSVKNEQTGEYIGCKKLKEFVFPNTLTYMRLNNYNNGNLFTNCTNLESITIPIKVTYIYNNFDGCTSLTDVYYMGSETQKAKINFPTVSSGTETMLLSSQVTWHCISYAYNISIDVGTDSNIAVSVTRDGSPVTNVGTITKGTPLTFTVTSLSYTTFKWKVDGALQESTSESLNVDTSTWVAGATYTVSLIATDAEGNEDSYYAQITVTE